MESVAGKVTRMARDYHFVTHWRVRAQAEEVYDIVSQPLEYPRWWPSVYLSARQVAAGGPGGIGRRILFHTKGWLPYTLQWEARTSEAVSPRRIVAEASGDFNGRGEWTFTQDGEYVDIAFDWKLSVAKPLLRYLTPVLRPAFEANHRWAMQQGEACLREELIRYRARTPQELLSAAEPRGPMEIPVRSLALAALAISALACIALVRRRPGKTHTATA